LEEEKGAWTRFKEALSRMWHKTVFPDMIAKKRAENQRKREEAKRIAEIKAEARMEALEELKPQIKERIKQQELDKLTGKSQGDWKEKLAKGFEMGGDTNKLNSTDKINQMLGIGGSRTGAQPQQRRDPVNMMGMGSVDPNAGINQMLGIKQPQQQPQQRKYYRKSKKRKAKQPYIPPPNKINDFENKIKRMLQ